LRAQDLLYASSLSVDGGGSGARCVGGCAGPGEAGAGYVSEFGLCARVGGAAIAEAKAAD
jgi:hypothetical protein